MLIASGKDDGKVRGGGGGEGGGNWGKRMRERGDGADKHNYK